MRQPWLKHSTCAGGKLVMKLVFVAAWAGATVAICMTGGAAVGMAMEMGGLFIMGCWCWGMTVAMAMARAGRLGTGGEGNWLRISTFIAGRPLWNKGKEQNSRWHLIMYFSHKNCIENVISTSNTGQQLLCTHLSPLAVNKKKRTFIWTDLTRRVKPLLHARL